MTTPLFRTVLLTVDLNVEDSWAKALPVAIEYCRAFGAELHVMTVVPDFGMNLVGQYFPEDFERKAVEAARAELAAFVDARVPDDVTATPAVGHGTIYEEIIAMAKRIGADLVVMAAHRPDLSDYLLGPNAARVVRHFTGSVLVVRD